MIGILNKGSVIVPWRLPVFPSKRSNDQNRKTVVSCFYHGGLQTTPVIDGLECHCKDPCETISAMECDKSFESCSFGRSSIQRFPILQKTHPHLFLGVSWQSLVSFVMGAGMNIRTFRMIIYIPRHANTSTYILGVKHLPFQQVFGCLQAACFSSSTWFPLFLVRPLHPPPASQTKRSELAETLLFWFFRFP